MTNYKEILRLQSLGINNTRIAEACGCARSTVISTLQYATAKGLKWDSVRDWTEKEVAERLLHSVAARQVFSAIELVPTGGVVPFYNAKYTP